MTKRLHSFKQHCLKIGIDLLLDDYRFIDKSLNRFKQREFKAILTRYTEEWLKGMGKTENVQHKQGMGRRMANQWLLNYADEVKTQPRDSWV